MPKVFISQPLTYDFRLDPRLSRRQNGSHKMLTKEQQKRTLLEREHYLPCKGRNNKAERQKQKGRFRRSVCSKKIRADNINFPQDWQYLEYQKLERNLERIKLEQKEIEFQRLNIKDVQVKKKVFVLTETPSSISNELNKSNTNDFPIEKWERWEMNNKSIEISKITPTEREYMKFFISLLTRFKPVKSLLNDWLTLPDYNIPTEKDMSEIKVNEAQTKLHEAEVLLKKKELFSDFLKNRNARIESIKDPILKEKAINLDSRDLKNQNLYGSTKALLDLIEEASEAFSNVEGISPQKAKDYLALIGAMMPPHPVVSLSRDADQIYDRMREHGTEAYFWLEKSFQQDTEINKNVGEKIHYPRTKSRFKFFTKVAKIIWYQIQPKIKSGTLHCRYPDWKEEVDSWIHSSALYGIELMQENRSVSQKVQAPEQAFSNMFDPD